MGREETLTQRPSCQRPPGPPQLHLAGRSGTGRMRRTHLGRSRWPCAWGPHFTFSLKSRIKSVLQKIKKTDSTILFS